MESRGYSLVAVCTFLTVVASLVEQWLSGVQASVAAYRLGSCGSWALRTQTQLLRCMDLVAPWHMGSSWIRGGTRVFRIGRWTLYHWGSREVQEANFLKKHLFLVFCTGSYLWHAGSSSLIRDWTWTPCMGSRESSPLDHQGSPTKLIFIGLKYIFEGLHSDLNTFSNLFLPAVPVKPYSDQTLLRAFPLLIDPRSVVFKSYLEAGHRKVPLRRKIMLVIEVGHSAWWLLKLSLGKDSLSSHKKTPKPL